MTSVLWQIIENLNERLEANSLSIDYGSVENHKHTHTQINTVVWCCALWSCTLTIMTFRTKEEKIGMGQAAAGVLKQIGVNQ